VINIQQRSLSTLEKNASSLVHAFVQEFRHIDKILRKFFAQGAGIFKHCIGAYGAGQGRNRGLHYADAFFHVPAELFPVVQITDPQSTASHLVFIRRPDPAIRGSNPFLTSPFLISSFNQAVILQYHVCAVADVEPPPAIDPGSRKAGDLLFQRNRVDDDAIPDNALFLRVQDPGRNQVENVFPTVDDNRVAGVVPALIPGNDVEMSGKQINDFAFALIPPLGTHDNQVGHEKIFQSSRFGKGAHPSLDRAQNACT
jgi:hypothetical protein